MAQLERIFDYICTEAFQITRRKIAGQAGNDDTNVIPGLTGDLKTLSYENNKNTDRHSTPAVMSFRQSTGTCHQNRRHGRDALGKYRKHRHISERYRKVG